MGKWVMVIFLILGVSQIGAQITIDGNPVEWTGIAPTTDNSWVYSAGTAGGLNEWIWKDAAGDQRTDDFGGFVDPTKQDLLELRIASDELYLYYLVKFPSNVDNTPGDGAIQLQISVRRNGSNAIEEWLGGYADNKVPTSTTPGGTVPDARWDFLIMTRAGSGSNDHIVWLPGFGSSSIVGSAAFNPTDGFYEGRIPWSSLGGQPTGQPVVFTFSIYRSKINDDTFDTGGDNTKGNCLDYVTTTTGNTYNALIGFNNNGVNDAAYLDYAFEMQFSGDQTLPVQLQAFTATVEDEAVQLQWVTESEINNAAFILERSLDNQYFMPIAEIPGSGNSNTRKVYSFIDRAVHKGNRYFYRLSDKSYQGTVTVLKTISVDFYTSNGNDELNPLPNNFQLLPAYPNPFNPVTTIQWAIPELSQSQVQVSIGVFDITGQLVTNLVNSQYAPGVYEIQWDGTDATGNEVPSGVYFVVMQAGAFQQAIKVIKIE